MTAPFFTIPAPCRVDVGATLAARILRRDGFACVYCGSVTDALEVDHLTPCAHFPADAPRSVVNDPANLVTACERCNAVKGSQDLDAFARMLEGRGIARKIITAMVRRVRAALRRPLPPLPDP